MQFPFFCSDREYIIGRRIWEDGKTYYCVTKVIVSLAIHFYVCCIFSNLKGLQGCRCTAEAIGYPDVSNSFA